jgi:hypothetical protein
VAPGPELPAAPRSACDRLPDDQRSSDRLPPSPAWHPHFNLLTDFRDDERKRKARPVDAAPFSAARCVDQIHPGDATLLLGAGPLASFPWPSRR